MKEHFKEHLIDSTDVQLFFSEKNKAVAAVESGDTVKFSLKSSFEAFSNHEGNYSLDKLDFTGINPLTGPLAVKDAVPGDTIAISIKEICPKGPGTVFMLDPRSGKAVINHVEIKNGTVELLPGVAIPGKLMVGTIGTTPAGAAVTATSAGNHGGNMDHHLVAAGSTVYLPVFIEGGMLLIGDAHALMGDGEVCTGVEIGAGVKAQINLIKSSPIEQPWIKTGNLLISTGYGPTFNDASRVAFQQMWDFVCKLGHLTPEQGYIFTGVCGNLRIGRGGSGLWITTRNLTTQFTARVEMPRPHLASLGSNHRAGFQNGPCSPF